MKKFIKTIALAMLLTIAPSLPVLAEETQPAIVDTTSIVQQIDYIRSLKIVPREGQRITPDARIFNLTVELYIHKLKFEPEEIFQSMVQETMFPQGENVRLTLKAKQFNSIAIQAMYGMISDDDAIYQLQILSIAE